MFSWPVDCRLQLVYADDVAISISAADSMSVVLFVCPLVQSSA